MIELQSPIHPLQESRSVDSAQLLQLILDNIPLAVFWKDRDSVYLGCNRNFAGDAGQGAPENVKAALAASVPFPKRLGTPDEFASLALEMCRNGYFNGESVRLDGAIRMAPR